MNEHDQKILAQQDRFFAELPDLLKTIPEKWVCYLDGVQHIAEDHDGAYGYGLKHYGMDGGFLVHQVVPRIVIPGYKLGGFGASALYEKQYNELKAKYDELHRETVKLREFVKVARRLRRAHPLDEFFALDQMFKALKVLDEEV